jgi:hypothetical protein
VKQIGLNLAALALSKPVQHYIRVQRDRLQLRSIPLSNIDKPVLSAYFSADDLKRTRIVISDPLPIPEAPLTGVIRHLGFNFPSVAATAAITFDHVIACRERPNISLLFHELVHTVQYRLVGVPAFARQYVKGFLATKSYRDIPLERCAFALQFRFETQTEPFHAESEIAKWLAPDYL